MLSKLFGNTVSTKSNKPDHKDDRTVSTLTFIKNPHSFCNKNRKDESKTLHSIFNSSNVSKNNNNNRNRLLILKPSTQTNANQDDTKSIKIDIFNPKNVLGNLKNSAFSNPNQVSRKSIIIRHKATNDNNESGKEKLLMSTETHLFNKPLLTMIPTSCASFPSTTTTQLSTETSNTSTKNNNYVNANGINTSSTLSKSWSLFMVSNGNVTPIFWVPTTALPATTNSVTSSSIALRSSTISNKQTSLKFPPYNCLNKDSSNNKIPIHFSNVQSTSPFHANNTFTFSHPNLNSSKLINFCFFNQNSSRLENNFPSTNSFFQNNGLLQNSFKFNTDSSLLQNNNNSSSTEMDKLIKSCHEFVYDNQGMQIHRCKSCSKLFSTFKAFCSHIMSSHNQAKNR